MSRMGFYLPYLSYTLVMPHTTVFTVYSSVDVTPFTPMTLAEIYRHVLLCMPVISVETSVHALTQYSVHVKCVHALTRSSVHVIPLESLIVLLHVCVSVHGILQESMMAVAVPCVWMLLCSEQSCEVNLAMDLGQIMSTLGVLLGIPCIISRNRHNIDPCSGLVKKSAYISTVGQYFRGTSSHSQYDPL